MVECTCSVQIFGDLAGKYRGGQQYPDDRLADIYPRWFRLVGGSDSMAAPDSAETDKPKKRRK